MLHSIGAQSRGGRTLLRLVRHLVKMPPGHLFSKVFQLHSDGRRLCGRPRTRWRDRIWISTLAWEHLSIPQSKLASVAGEREF